MRAGALRHYVALQNATETQGASGMASKSWTTFASVYARVSPVSGQERKLGPQTIAANTHEVEIRYNSSVIPQTRILFGSRYLYVKEIINADERNIYQRLLCEERV